MTLQDVSWLALAAYTVHIMEEFSFDWRGWARAVIKLPVEWSDFYVTNAAVVVLGIVQAQLAPTVPIIALAYASLMLINATFFHVLPVILTKGRFSPGLATAVMLFYPVGIGIFRKAGEAGVLNWSNGVGAVVIGAMLMAYPVVMLRLRSNHYFRQS